MASSVQMNEFLFQVIWQMENNSEAPKPSNKKCPQEPFSVNWFDFRIICAARMQCLYPALPIFNTEKKNKLLPTRAHGIWKLFLPFFSFRKWKRDDKKDKPAYH